MPSPGKPTEEQYSSHPPRIIKVRIIKISNIRSQQTDLLSELVGGFNSVWQLRQEVAIRLLGQTVLASQRRQTAIDCESGRLDECSSGSVRS